MVLRALTAVLFGLVVFFGATTIARAAIADRPLPSDALSAPFCDERAASAYADEPRPVPAESGTIAARGTDACSFVLAESFGALPARDDLQRTPPTAREVAIVPLPITLPGPTLAVHPRTETPEDGARDGFERIDGPPPRA